MGTSSERRVDEKGRVTLPQSIRESLGIEAGEEVTVELDDGRIVIRVRVSRETFVEEMTGCITADTRADSAEPTTRGLASADGRRPWWQRWSARESSDSGRTIRR